MKVETRERAGLSTEQAIVYPSSWWDLQLSRCDGGNFREVRRRGVRYMDMDTAHQEHCGNLLVLLLAYIGLSKHES